MSTRLRLIVALVALVLVLAAIAASVGRTQSPPSLWTFEVDVQAPAGSVAQLFWAADWRFVEERSTRVPLQPTGDGFQRLRIVLPSQNVRWLRFDPSDAPGEILIRQMQVVDANQQLIRTFDVHNLKPAHQIASISQQGAITRLTTAPGARDPFVFASLGCLGSQSLRDRLSTLTPTAIALGTLATVGLLGACVLVVGRDAFGRGATVDTAGEHTSVWLSVLWIAVLFLVVFSAKLLLMHQNPVTVPFWDQWDGEARVLYLPYSECGLGWEQMFSLHNEHRVVFTRLLALDLLSLNGQWDPRLQSLVNAGMHALTAVLLVLMLWTAHDRRRLDLLVVIGGLTFSLPFAWENVLLGFQSAFYFLLLFSILGVWLTTAYRAGTSRWWLGWLCALCGLFSAAGGVTLPAVIGGIVLLNIVNDPRQWRQSLVTLVAAGGVLALGILTASAPLPHHEPLRAKTIADFSGALARNLAWPWVEHPLASLMMWVPIGVLLLMVASRRGKTTVLERFILGLGFWVALQAAATAYGRGAGAPVPASRYQDFLSLGFVANTMAIVAILDRALVATTARRVAIATLAIWMLMGTVGMDRLVVGAQVSLAGWRPLWRAQADNVRRFVIGRDFAEFTSKRGLEIPYPDAQVLAGVLQDPYIRRILPAAVRDPVAVEPQAVTNEAFVSEGTYPTTPRDPLVQAWGTYTGVGNVARGAFESRPIASCELNGYLQFQVAGYLGMRREYLAVKDLTTGHEREVRPATLAREDWLSVNVACPTGPFAIVASDARSDYWFSFREPVEVGRLSPLVEWLIASSPRLLFGALALALIAARWTNV